MSDTTDVLPQILSLPVSKILVSRHQVRKEFDEEGIKSLSVSIEKEGLIQPITVRQVAGEIYELIAGERRLRAIKLLGRENIAAIVVDVPSEAAAAAKGLMENIQRRDLNPMEEATGYKDLQNLDPKYWTQEQIALIAGKTQGYISQGLSLLDLAEPIQENISRLIFSRAQGVELARISDKSKQLEIFERAKGRNREQTRKLVDEALAGTGQKKAGRKPKAQDPLEGLWPADFCEAGYSKAGWTLKLSSHLVSFTDRDQARKALANLLGMIQQALLADPASEPELAAPAEPTAAPEVLPKDLDNPPAFRLPKTPEEEAELKKIGEEGGIEAFMTWIYGPGSPYLNDVKGLTWQTAGFKDAQDGMTLILAGLRMNQEPDDARGV